MENLTPLTPVNFFQLSCQSRYLSPRNGGKFGINSRSYVDYLLPDTSTLTHEEKFAEVSLGWNEEGIEIFANVQNPLQRCNFPQIERGDSLEVCIDTRNIKTSGYNTRFCHHFYCLPEAVEGRRAGEITRFRSEDTHPLCDPENLLVESKNFTHGYHLQFFIPLQALFGYDPEQVGWLGFTYRVNRLGGRPQHFSVCSSEYQFEQQPSLWSSIRLVR